ncbi:MAG: tetratricopeptide repeat protein [Cyanobacteria bacterium P01_G01_bin.54]
MFGFLRRNCKDSSKPAQSPTNATLTDEDYAALFEQLLTGALVEGWDDGQIVALVARGGDASDWGDWLGRWEGAEAMDRVRLAQLVGRLQGVKGLDGLWRPLEKVVALLVLADGEREVEVETVGVGSPLDVDAVIQESVQYFQAGQYQDALAVLTRAIEAAPQEHKLWIAKGDLMYAFRQYEKAIASYDKALEFKLDLHEAWSNRGVALENLGRNEEAIASYDKALEIKPDYHEAWSNRGIALKNLGRCEEAIESYDKALKVKPNEYGAWYNRGIVLKNRGRYEEAIASYDKALEFKPDDHEAWYNRGNSLKDLGKFKEAIASYEKAVEIKPDKHEAWINRAIAVYSALGQSPTFVTLQPSTVTLHLTKRGYAGAIETYQEGLKYCPQETHPLGWGMLMHYMGKRHYIHSKHQPNRQKYNHQALHCYTQALQTLTPQDHPTEHLKLLQDLVKVHLALGDPDTAHHHQLAGLEILKQLLNAAKSQRQKSRIEAQFHSFRQLTVDVLLENAHPIEALTSAELNKNRCLAMLASDPVSPDYDQIQSLVTANTALVAWHLSPERLTTFLVQAGAAEPKCWVQDVQPFLDWLEDWDNQYADYRPKKKEATDNHADKNKDQPNHPWRTGMVARLEKLAEILQIATLAEHLTPTPHLILVPHRDLHRLPIHALFTDSVGAIPPWLPQTGNTGAHPQPDMIYLPSIQTGLNLSAAPPRTLPTQPALLSIENPQNDLDFAHIESAVINARFQHLTHLTAETAAHDPTLTALQKAHDLCHFTGHGAYNSRNPEASALALQNNDATETADQLTAAEIRDLDLSPYHLIYLAACETALTGQSSIEEEYVGLVSACLQAQTRAVISTLWSVEEISSAWLAIRFYQLWLDDQLPIAQALHQAQTWLRTVTKAQLIQWLEQLAQNINNTDDRNLIKDEIGRLKSSSRMDSSSLYAHPYYWAAFTLTGGIA